MPDESPQSEPESTEKSLNPSSKKSHNYPRNRKPVQGAVQSPANPAIMAMEAALPPLMDQRMAANQRVRAIQHRANQINMELEAAKDELAQIEGEVQYRLQTIAAMKGVPFVPQAQAPQFASTGMPYSRQFNYPPQQLSSPMYMPIQPFPSFPAEGVGSIPADNRGLYPDASERTESAEDFKTPELRAQFERYQG